MSSFTVACDTSLGKLVWIELDKQGNDLFPVDSWFLDKVEVKSEEEHTYTFPIYRRITDSEVHCFSEGTGLWRFDVTEQRGHKENTAHSITVNISMMSNLDVVLFFSV